MNCKIIKKWQPPISKSTPSPFSDLSPLSSKKFCTPLSDSIFRRSYHPFNKGGGGVPTMIYIYIYIYNKNYFWIHQKDQNHIDLYYVSVKLKSRSENFENNHSLPFLTQSGPNFWLESPHKWIFLKQILIQISFQWQETS